MTTSIEKDALLSTFSVLAYRDAEFLENPANLPTGWQRVRFEEKGSFAAFAFQNASTGEVIIAYRGTDGLNDAFVDKALLTGSWDQQFKQGIDFANAVRSDDRLFPPGADPRQLLLVTGHSSGGGIAQVVAQAFGLDGSAIDPGAAARVVGTAEFKAAVAALNAGLPETGLGIADGFTNHLVVDSTVSGGTGPQLGKVSYMPSLNFSGSQALTTFLIGLLSPIAGLAYGIGTDQFSNKHNAEQISQALQLMAGASDAANLGPDTVILTAKIIRWDVDDRTQESKPTYSQTEFEIRNKAGDLQGTVVFSERGSDRQMQILAGDGSLKSTTILASSGAVTIQPVVGDSVTVGVLPGSAPDQDGTINVVTRAPDGSVVSVSNRVIYEDNSSNETINYASGKVEVVARDESGFKSSITWRDPDGSSGRETFSPTGLRLSSSWKNADGSGGVDIFKPDGSMSGSYVRADGSYQRYGSDGKGNGVIMDYARDGNLRSSAWWKADGSHGREMISEDGGRMSTIYSPDGRYANYSSDRAGNNTGSFFDANGQPISSAWSNIDGNSGSILVDPKTKVVIYGSKDGKGGETSTVYDPNGSVKHYVTGKAGTGVVDDGQGLRIETQFGPGGIGVESNSVIRYNSDGSGTVTRTDGDGRVTEKSYPPGTLSPLKKPNGPDSTPLQPPVAPESKPIPIFGPDPWFPPKNPVDSGDPTTPISDEPPSQGPLIPSHDPILPSDDPAITPEIESRFDEAQKLLQPIRRDPLVFDMDGDGIETVALDLNHPILFDHSGNGIKTATGWVKADDAFLAYDRNGNGVIDSGKELFGDATALYSGGTAVDGFAALAQEDGNHDGIINAADAHWASLRLWRDANQDGVSQSNELMTLAAAGIQSVTVASTDHTQTLANGNQVADLGSYTRSDGSQGRLAKSPENSRTSTSSRTLSAVNSPTRSASPRSPKRSPTCMAAGKCATCVKRRVWERRTATRSPACSESSSKRRRPRRNAHCSTRSSAPGEKPANSP